MEALADIFIDTEFWAGLAVGVPLGYVFRIMVEKAVVNVYRVWR